MASDSTDSSDTTVHPIHKSWMRHALRLAMRGYGSVSPNPMVGALLVSAQGVVLGEGWHERAGEPHAEPRAIQSALQKGAIPQGATLYVTLEPCCSHGRTPPCTGAILKAGIGRVVMASPDPNPAHAGKGIELLRSAGVEVIEGIERARADLLNEAFFHWIQTGMPWTLGKSAMSLDGKIATKTGESKWITSPQSRAKGMRLRLGSDAILVGVGSVIADDPSLTCRSRSARADKSWTRIILDPKARTPLESQLVKTASKIRTLVFVSENADALTVNRLEERGVEVRRRPFYSPPDAGDPENPSERPSGFDLNALNRELGSEGITQLLIEGGGETLGRAFAQRLIQRIHFFYAPKLIGGSAAPRAVGGPGAGRWEDMLRLSEIQWRRLGCDAYLTAKVSVWGKDAPPK